MGDRAHVPFGSRDGTAAAHRWKIKNCHDIALMQLSTLAELATSTLHVLSLFLQALLKAPQPELRIQVPMFCTSCDQPTVTKKAKGTPEHTKMMKWCRGIKYI